MKDPISGTMDYHTLEVMRSSHPGWKLLTAEHAPFVAGFLHRTFIQPNVRTLLQQELASKFEDYRYHLRNTMGEGFLPRKATQYLDEWASDEKGWLRKYYPAGSDEPGYDLTPATEKALDWLQGLQHRQFVGTESRLMLVFELLRQIASGTEENVETRLAELEKSKAKIEREIEQVRLGKLEFLDPTRIKENFMQMEFTARGLLSDFREVEQNFRELDRGVREKIATFEGGKAVLLEDVLGKRDAIDDSDQGRSFNAFWNFLMSPARQEELTSLLERVVSLEPVQELHPDKRLLRVHYDWLEAGEVTQRMVARLSQQLRRYLDDRAFLENKRIMQMIHDVEQNALAVKQNPPKGGFMDWDEAFPSSELPLERPLFQPPVQSVITENVLSEGDQNISADLLFEQRFVDKTRLISAIRLALQDQSRITLGELVARFPLEHGLAELITYMNLATENQHTFIDEEHSETILWTDDKMKTRQATLPRIVFNR